MYTYIIESQGYYKIGKTFNMEQRLREYFTHNPKYEVLCVISGDYEAILHEKYANKRFRGEWFYLDELELKELLTIDVALFSNLENTKNNSSFRQTRNHYGKLKDFPIGMYDYHSNKLLKVFNSPEEAHKITGIGIIYITRNLLKLSKFSMTKTPDKVQVYFQNIK